MEKKLFDSELKIMQLIWQNEPVSAKKVSLLADDAFGWNKNTTYTVLKKLEAKGFIKREDPGFVCTSLVSMEQVQEYETRELINKMYHGSADLLVASLIGQQKLSDDEIARLKALVNRLEG